LLLAGSTDPKVYAAQLFNVQYQGVTAKIAFEPDGELKSPSMTLYIYKDGRKLPLN
jgi:branched-chain amino acid transport system substrate-binding protein